MPKDLTNGVISEQSIARVSEDHVQRLNRHMIQKGDILYSYIPEEVMLGVVLWQQNTRLDGFVEQDVYELQ